MTDQQLIIAVAKLDGWIEERPNLPQMPTYYRKEFQDRVRVFDDPKHFSAYLTSLDAIIPVIRKQSEAVKNAFGEALCEILGYYDDYYEGWNIHSSSINEFITATPKQLAIALVKACGNWEE